MFQQMNDWWLGLESRERLLLKIMAGFLILFIAYSFIWKPIQTAKVDAENKRLSALKEWTWLNEQIPQIQMRVQGGGSAQKTEINDQNELLKVLQASLRKENLFKQIKKVQGAGSQGARVTFDSVVASRLMKWLGRLEQKGLVASKLQLTSLGVDTVKAKVEFDLSKP